MYEMKPYQVIECPDLNLIQKATLEYVEKYYPTIWQEHTLWHRIDTIAFLKQSDALLKWFKDLGLKIREVSFTVMNKDEDVALHIDELPVTAKINVPILNTKHTLNRWYSVPQSLKDDKKFQFLNKFGKKYWLFENVDLTTFEMLGEYELLQPIVFNSQIGHTVHVEKEASFPRLVLSCMFFNEPTQFL